MAIRATYDNGSTRVVSAVIKLDRIWGSKKEQWNAWVHVFANDSDSVPMDVFSVTATYVEGENPYVALYGAVSQLNTISDVVHDIQPDVIPKESAAVENDALASEPEKPTRKTRKK